MNEYKLVSIQSVAGGTGKTTYALDLAEKLVKSGQAVLVLDFDIAGVNMIHSCSEDIFNILSNKDVPENLMKMFSSYMAGSIVQLNNIHNDKINVLGSEYYTADKESRYSPNEMCDTMHTSFAEIMIRDLIRSFESKISTSIDVTIILDNASGYRDLVPMSENMIYELGPERGSIVWVYTPRCFEQTEKEVDRCKKILEKYWKTSRVFHQLTGGGSEVDEDINKKLFVHMCDNMSSGICRNLDQSDRFHTCPNHQTGCNLCFYMTTDKTKRDHIETSIISISIL